MPSGRQEIAKDGENTRFKKGQSGNPNGRPEGSISFGSLMDKILEGEITLEEAEGQYTKVTKRHAMVFKIIQDAIEEDDPNIRLKAAQIVMERTEGKAVQPTDNKHSFDDSIRPIVQLSLEYDVPEKEAKSGEGEKQKPKAAKPSK